jgi:ribosomal protein S12 methylthiotransferase accessory factor YcaO
VLMYFTCSGDGCLGATPKTVIRQALNEDEKKAFASKLTETMEQNNPESMLAFASMASGFYANQYVERAVDNLENIVAVFRLRKGDVPVFIPLQP